MELPEEFLSICTLQEMVEQHELMAAQVVCPKGVAMLSTKLVAMHSC